MSTQTFDVVGMTCDHCATAAAKELSSLAGVRDVAVSLVAGGTSTVTITSAHELDPAAVSASLDEAGDYRLAP